MKLIKSALFATAFAMSVGSFAVVANAAEIKFSQAKYKQYKASGQGFMLDFYASWCSTCRVQDRVIKALKKNDPKLAKLPVMKVDWDIYSSKPISKDLKIPRRSTLVMFKGGREVGRVVAQTSSKKIQALMQRGL